PKPKEFKLEALPAWLVEALGTNLVLMAKSLFEHADQLAAFIGALATLTATKSALAGLICNGVKTDNVKAQTESEVDSGAEDAASGAEAGGAEAAGGAGARTLREG